MNGRTLELHLLAGLASLLGVIAAVSILGCDHHEHEQSGEGDAHDNLHADLDGDREDDGHEDEGHDDDGHEHDDHDESAPAETTHLKIPPAVRRNLGITFVRAELRPVRSTIRLPGQFELRPEARREYHTMLPGRVRLAVEQYQAVEKGETLYELESPEWHRVQSKLAEAFKACYCCIPELESARATKQENEAELEAVQDRVTKLTGASARDAALEMALVKLKARRPRLEAEIEAKKADMQSALLAYDVLLNEAQSLTGIARDELERLLEPDEDEDEEQQPLAIPHWSTVKKIIVRAEAPGIVNRIDVTNAGWAETGDLVLDTVNPQALRFHADTLQTDINRFRDGQSAKIAPPPGGSIHLQDTIDGTIEVGFQAHPEQRTVPVYVVPSRLPRWAKAGVTAYLEVFLQEDDQPVVAIPEAAVVRDGLEMVYFLREADDPECVIRMKAELGTSDGRWVEIKSGLQPGDEVVLDGVYPLVLASSTSGQTTQGGHMHADGTLQTDDH